MKALDLLDRLDKVSGGNGKWMARCPAHSDNSPSLSVSDTEDKVLLHCFAGCKIEDVTAAMRINVSDLFYQSLTVQGMTVAKRKRFEEILTNERIQVAIINVAEQNERPLTNAERQRRQLSLERINKIEGALYE
jgi:hypothetical protein